MIDDNVKKITPREFKDMLTYLDWEGKKMPENLHVCGPLDFELINSKCKSLPNKLIIDGYLDLIRCPIETLPDDIVVRSWVRISYTNIEKLPDNFTVGGNLNISKSPIRKLSKKLVVNGWIHMDVDQRKIDLPDDLIADSVIYHRERIERPINLQPPSILFYRNKKYAKLRDSAFFGRVISFHNNNLILKDYDQLLMCYFNKNGLLKIRHLDNSIHYVTSL